MPPTESTHRGREGAGGPVAGTGRAVAPSRRGRLPDPGIALVVARIEWRRSLRRLREHDLWLLAMALLTVPTALFVWVTFGLSREAGAAVAAGESGALDAVPAVLAAVWLLHVGFFVVAGVGNYGDLDRAAGLLSVRPARDFAGGLFVVNCWYYSPYLLIGTAAGYAGLAVGTGSALPLIGGFAAAAVLLVVAAAVGFPVGLSIKGALRRSAAPAWLRPALGAVVGVAYVYVMFTGTWLAVLEGLAPALSEPPLRWLGDLALATTPGADASALGALGAVGVAALALPIGLLASVRAAEYAWYADREEAPDDGTDAADATASRVGRRIGGAVGAVLDVVCRRPPTRGVAEVVLLRAYRAPMQLLYAGLPLLFALPLVEGLLASGTLPWYAPWLAVPFGAWVAGETFALNVLGNQGATLPTLLTSRADGRAVVHGHVVAVALPLAPLTAAVAVGAGLFAGRPTAALPLYAGASVAAVVAGAVLAAGIGSLFPRFEALTVAGSREVAVPSKRALGAFSSAISLGTVGVAFVADETARVVGALVLPRYLPRVDAVEPASLEGVGWVVVLGLAAAVPAAYVVATRRIDGFRLD